MAMHQGGSVLAGIRQANGVRIHMAESDAMSGTRTISVSLDASSTPRSDGRRQYTDALLISGAFEALKLQSVTLSRDHRCVHNSGLIGWHATRHCVT